jgi:hypothetical protein
VSALWRRFVWWLARLDWPLVRRGRHNELRLENMTLRDALRNANDEVRRHRALIAGLRDGDERVTESVRRVIGAVPKALILACAIRLASASADAGQLGEITGLGHIDAAFDQHGAIVFEVTSAGIISFDWPAIEKCAAAPTPNDDTHYWEFRETMDCRLMLWSHHAGWTDAGRAGADDPYQPVPP